MAQFHYTAREKDGREVSGDRDAEDQYALSRVLRTEGLTVLSLVASEGARKKKSLNDYTPTWLQPIKLEEKINFTRNIGVMIGSGLSLVRALEVMTRQTRNPRFQKIIFVLVETVKRGKTFAEALGEHSAAFPKFYQEMVRAGEQSGQLESSLKLIALQLNKDYILRRKVRSAMMYPAIIMCAMVGIGILMMLYVVPTLISTFKDLGVALPASTRFIIFISESLLQSGLILLIGTGVIVFLLYRYAKTEQGKQALDWLFSHLPVIGSINQKFNAARTCRTLSSLVDSGVDILEALSITKNVIQNHLYQNVLDGARTHIAKGETIASAFLSAENLYPPLVGEMIAVGEETGELSTMLLRLATFYENEVSVATKDLSTIIEPLLMIIIGVGVGFFAISMISPMYSLVGGF